MFCTTPVLTKSNVFLKTMKTTLLATILLLSIAVSEVIGVPVAENCAAKYQASLNETLTLKESCEEAEFRDCCQVTKASNLFNNYSQESGVYDISNVCGDMTQPFALDALPAMQARCDMENDDGGWLVLVRRTPDVDERVSFDRTWDDYEKGFGDLNTEFWYGLKNIHCLTNREKMQVRFDLKRTDGTSVTWTYNKFVVDGPDNQYTLHVGKPQQTGYDYLEYHNGVKFSTRDKDNDGYEAVACATAYPGNGGWFFNHCYNAFLTQSTGAQTYQTSHENPYAYAEMKIRPLSCDLSESKQCE